MIVCIICTVILHVCLRLHYMLQLYLAGITAGV